MMYTNNSLDMSLLLLACGEDGDGFISVDCGITDANDMPKCNVSIANFCDQYYTTSVIEKTITPKDSKCITDTGPFEKSMSESTSEGVTIINRCNTCNSSNSTTIAVLGALVGLLLVLLVIVTTGLVWTCRLTAGKKTNSDKPR